MPATVNDRSGWNAVASSAPIVPAPAYGVKELEWSEDYANTPIGRYAIRRTPDGYEVSVDGEEIAHLGFDAPRAQPSARDAARDYAQADFECCILSCLSSAPVEEADAKAAAWIYEWSPFGHEMWQPGVSLSDPLVYGGVRQYRNVRPLFAPTIPSEPEAKGEAGAGPAGEADFYAVSTRTGMHVGLWKDRTTAENVLREYEEGTLTPLYTSPADEPGEVERITRERDALAEALEQINSTSLSEVFDGRIGEIVSAAREVLAGRFDFNAHSLKVDLARETKRADTAEAALAETRERLEREAPHWRPIEERDRIIETIQTFGDVTLRNSHPVWVRDADGRVYEAVWTVADKGRGYWWDTEGESPADPADILPHPLTELAALSTQESSAAEASR